MLFPTQGPSQGLSQSQSSGVIPTAPQGAPQSSDLIGQLMQILQSNPEIAQQLAQNPEMVKQIESNPQALQQFISQYSGSALAPTEPQEQVSQTQAPDPKAYISEVANKFVNTNEGLRMLKEIAAHMQSSKSVKE